MYLSQWAPHRPVIAFDRTAIFSLPNNGKVLRHYWNSAMRIVLPACNQLAMIPASPSRASIPQANARRTTRRVSITQRPNQSRREPSHSTSSRGGRTTKQDRERINWAAEYTQHLEEQARFSRTAQESWSADVRRERRLQEEQHNEVLKLAREERERLRAEERERFPQIARRPTSSAESYISRSSRTQKIGGGRGGKVKT
jgi:hypothetical protein